MTAPSGGKARSPAPTKFILWALLGIFLGAVATAALQRGLLQPSPHLGAAVHFKYLEESLWSTHLWEEQHSRRPALKPAREPARELAIIEESKQLFDRIKHDLKPFAANGINQSMVDQAYCTSKVQGFRFQVIDGRLYVVGQMEGFQTRLLNMQRQLWALSQQWRLPDVDMMIEQDDFPTSGDVTPKCPQRGPLIAPAKFDNNAPHEHVVLAPDHTFGEWVESTTLSWNEMHPLLAAANADNPWAKRNPSLFFRGAPTGETRPLLAEWLKKASNNSHLDVVVDPEIHAPANFKSLYEHCTHKYLLHVPGWSYSGRLKYLLGCGSSVLWLEQPGHKVRAGYQEFWTHLLQDGLHLRFIPTSKDGNMAAQLSQAVAELAANDSMAQRMGGAARHLIQEVLTPDNVQEYWRRLLLQYAALQTFKPQKHPDAVPIEEALVSKRVIKPEERNCTRYHAECGAH